MSRQEQEIIHRQSRTIAVMFVIILLLIALLLFLTLCRSGRSVASELRQEPVGLCGTDALERSEVERFSKIEGLRGDYDRGKKLFRQNCAMCHALSDQVLTGPGLKGVFYRVPGPGAEWLRKYILNNELVKQNGDAYALKLSDQFKTSMTVFEGQLNDRQIDDLIYFVAGHN